MNKKSSINRRHFLRGVGATVALPSLQCFAPVASRATSEVAANAALKMAFIYTPNGVIPKQWNPTGEGADWQLSPTLSSLAPVKKDLQVISGLAHDKANANGDGGGDHARANATFLTGVQARKTAGADIRVGVSVDQVAALANQGKSRLDSLQLGCDPGRRAGNCDSGYSCAYQYNMSWRSATLPLAPEIDPRLVFEKLFGSQQSAGDRKSQQRRLAERRSVLDFVLEDAKSMQQQLGYTDRLKMDEYLTGVRELEQKIENAENFSAALPDADRPTGIPTDYGAHIRLMYDLMVMAFQSETTSVVSFLTAHDGSNRSFKDIGVAEGHHHLSHHRDDAKKVEKIARIDKFYADQFAYFVKKMKSTETADGRNLLDDSMIVFGGAISDANRHDHENLPVVLAGRGGGSLRAGRHLKLKQQTPMTDLYLSLLSRVGIEQERLGDSTGKLELI
jgi:hypothetical protein